MDTNKEAEQQDAEVVAAGQDHGSTLVRDANRAAKWLQDWLDGAHDFNDKSSAEAFDAVERLEGSLVALERSEDGTIGALIWHLLSDYKIDEPVAHDLWLSDDVDQQANQEDYDPLTDSEKAEVLALMQRRKDCNYGLNWDVVSAALDEAVPAKRRDSDNTMSLSESDGETEAERNA